MRINRDVYKDELNDIEKQFAQHNLEKDMAEAARRGPPIFSKRDFEFARIGAWLGLAMLICLVVWLCYIFGAF